MNELMALKENMLQVQYIIESNNVSHHTFPYSSLNKNCTVKVQKYGCYYTNHWSVTYKVQQALKKLLNK